jgi:hypothetical protein
LRIDIAPQATKRRIYSGDKQQFRAVSESSQAPVNPQSRGGSIEPAIAIGRIARHGTPRVDRRESLRQPAGSFGWPVATPVIRRDALLGHVELRLWDGRF